MDSRTRLKVCETLEYRRVGTVTHLFRSRDRKVWEVDICKLDLFWELWAFFSTERTLDDAQKAFDRVTEDELTMAVEGLVECGILEEPYEPRVFDKMLRSKVTASQIQSLSYHLSSSRIDWIDYSDGNDIKSRDLDEMDRKVREEPIPANYKVAANSEPKYSLSHLVPSSLFGELNDGQIVFGRGRGRTVTPLSLDALNALLNLTFSQIDSVNMYATGEHIRKPVPSGGARHPIEAYVAISEGVGGIEQGLYHYNVKSHRLDRIDVTDSQTSKVIRAASLLPRSRTKPVKAVILHSCMFERSMFRYRESRSYRVMNFDLGHIHANEVLAAKLMGLDFNECYSVPDSFLEAILTVDPLRESVMSSFVLH